MLTYKALVIAAFLVVAYFLGRTIRYGRRIAKQRRNGEELGGSFARHKRYANQTFISTVVAIVITEVVVRLNGGADLTPLFAVHLSFALPFFILLTIARFWVTGLKSPRHHKKIIYSCLACFLGTLATGSVLLYNM